MYESEARGETCGCARCYCQRYCKIARDPAAYITNKVDITLAYDQDAPAICSGRRNAHLPIRRLSAMNAVNIKLVYLTTAKIIVREEM